MGAPLKRDTVATARARPHRRKGATTSGDSITILKTLPGHFATKHFVMTDGVPVKRDYSAGAFFLVLEPWVVHNIFELSDLLSALEGMPDYFAIRGAPRDKAHVGKLKQRTGSKGTGNFETPREGHHWVLIDFDKIEVPAHTSLERNPVAVCEHLVSLLPPEFHDAHYHFQLSSSAGMSADPSKVSIHLWFWLAQPTTNETLKHWAKSVNLAAGFKLVDDALFRDVQIHYTAVPIFEGMPDPFPERSGLIEKARLAVDMVAPKVTTSSMKSRIVGGKSATVMEKAGSGIDYHLSLIGDHAGGNGFHNAIVAAAASYVGTHGIEGTGVEALFEVISAAILEADASRHDAAYVETMASHEHIMPAIESALRKFGSQATGPKAHTGIQPHFKSDPISLAEAEKQLAAFATLGL